MSSNGWIGVDLDGTLAEYHGWVNTFHIGPPIPRMVERVKQWLAEGKDVRIFTARVDGGEVAGSMGVDAEIVARYREVAKIVEMIQIWCEEHVGTPLPVTCKKDYGMIELWDDRACRVIPNTGESHDEIIAALRAELDAARQQVAELQQNLQAETWRADGMADREYVSRREVAELKKIAEDLGWLAGEGAHVMALIAEGRTVAALEAEIAERDRTIAALTEDLRRWVICERSTDEGTFDCYYCACCGETWVNEESHDPTCLLAAPAPDLPKKPLTELNEETFGKQFDEFLRNVKTDNITPMERRIFEEMTNPNALIHSQCDAPAPELPLAEENRRLRDALREVVGSPAVFERLRQVCQKALEADNAR